MNNQQRSVYRRGADDGFIFGAYLCVLILLLGYTPYVPWCSLPALLLMMFVPVVIYRMLRRSYVRDFGLTTFSELWLQGIVTFVCGSLLMAAMAYVFMRFLKPDFVVEQVKAAAELYRSMPDNASQNMAHMLDLTIERKMLPAPIYVVVELMLISIFTGSILSMIITWAVRLRRVRSKLDDSAPNTLS